MIRRLSNFLISMSNLENKLPKHSLSLVKYSSNQSVVDPEHRLEQNNQTPGHVQETVSCSNLAQTSTKNTTEIDPTSMQDSTTRANRVAKSSSASTDMARASGMPQFQMSQPSLPAKSADSQPGDLSGQNKQLSKRAQKRQARRLQRIEECKKAKVEFQPIRQGPRKPSFIESALNETDYYFENGLRKVYPYNFDFSTYAKRRWVGKMILEVFTQEFKKETPENYAKLIKTGVATVNGRVVNCDYKFKDNDYLVNNVHRHEQPVTDVPIEIIEDSEDLLVVNKPASVPVHPCGRYRHNSLVFILAKEHGYKDLRTVNRLDRLTSGVYLLPKTEAKTQELTRQVKGQQIQKEYVCMVDGEFPEETVECKEALDLLTPKIGLFRVTASGKPSSTTFKRLSYNGKTSVLKCWPHTGRTHQIRVHLQYLGFPIVNDPLYTGKEWGPERGRGGNFGRPDKELIEDLIHIHNPENYEQQPQDGGQPISKSDTRVAMVTDEAVDAGSGINKDPDSHQPSPCKSETSLQTSTAVEFPSHNVTTPAHKAETTTDSFQSEDNDQATGRKECTTQGRPGFQPSKFTYRPNCRDCNMKYRDPTPDELVMYLHALKYQGPDWEYHTDLPEWASNHMKANS